MSAVESTSTLDSAYASRLQRLSRRGGLLRRVIDPQVPYRWKLRRLRPGRVIDVGCGIGRNLKHLDGNGVGIDHNDSCVAACRADGLTAYTADDFLRSPDAIEGAFDSLLLSHVIEHMTDREADALISEYLPYVRPGGRIIMITPQERGQRSDATHVQLIDPAAVYRLASRLRLRVESIGSFPFPRRVGRWFTYNETVSQLTRRGEG